MKKWLIIFVTAVIFSIPILSGCGADTDIKSQEYIVATDMVKYNLHGIEDFGFNVNLISRNKDIDVEFLGFEGENTQGLSVQLNDDSYEEIKKLNHNGYYIRLLGFVCKTADDYVKIDSVNLKIDGADKKFDFPTPIEHYLKNDDTDSYAYVQDHPVFISTNSYSSSEYCFKYCAEDEITVQSFAFNDFWRIKSAVVSVDDVEIGGPDSLPLTLKKGSELSVKCVLDFKNSDNTADYDSIYCDSVLTYALKSGKQFTLYNNLISQSISNEDDAKCAIDYILKNKIK